MKRFLIILFIILFMPCASFSAANKTHIDVAFTIDNNYPIFTCLAINSILNSNWSKSDYTFWVIENNITPQNKEMMRKFVEGKKQKIEFINIDTDSIDKGKNLYQFSNRITPIAMARIMLPELLPKTVHRVIYLDADIFVDSDLKILYLTPLGNYNAAMAHNNSQDNGALGLYRFKHGYYNSGVILMNLDRCRKDHSTQQMLNFLRKHEKYFIYKKNDNQKKNSKWLYPDQDLINIVWDGRIKLLDQRWNNQCIDNFCLTDNYNGAIVHYIGKNKPWDFAANERDRYYSRDYYVLWKKSPFRKYMYYYIFKSKKKLFMDMCDKKIKRYKHFLKNLKKYNMEEPIYWMFYVNIDEVN